MYAGNNVKNVILKYKNKMEVHTNESLMVQSTLVFEDRIKSITILSYF